MGGINKSLVYRYLKKCRENTGGYTGTDIVKLVCQLNVNRTTLNRNIEKWSEVDMRFSDIKYLGKRYISLTLDEILEIEHNLEDNPLMVKKYLLESINANNLRYTDSNEFQNNRYFIQRYVSDRSLDLELSFM